jgi:hypothetical protein
LIVIETSHHRSPPSESHQTSESLRAEALNDFCNKIGQHQTNYPIAKAGLPAIFHEELRARPIEAHGVVPARHGRWTIRDFAIVADGQRPTRRSPSSSSALGVVEADGPEGRLAPRLDANNARCSPYQFISVMMKSTGSPLRTMA